MTSPVRIACEPADHALGDVLVEVGVGAVRRLDLDRHLDSLLLCPDDLSSHERAWLSFGRLAGEERRSLVVYLHLDEVLKDRPGRMSLMPEPGSWENLDHPRGEGPGDGEEFSRRKAERFLYHQLLFARDLCEGRVDPGDVPATLAEAFQEVWAVNIDGRLRAARLPGWSAAERRRRFSRAFSYSGVLVPEHWQIFHDLWDGGEISQEVVLRMLRRMPAARGK